MTFDERKSKIDSFWKEMTNEEQLELAVRSLFGQIINNSDGSFTLIMSGYGCNRLKEYQEFLIEKYDKLSEIKG